MKISIVELKKAVQLLEAEEVENVLAYFSTLQGENTLNLCALKDEGSPLTIFLTTPLSKVPSSKSITTSL